MPFFPLENTWTRAKEKGVQPEFVAKITPSCPTYPTSFFPEASARAPAHAHTHIHLCNPAPSVNSPSDVSRVLPMRGLCGWAPAAPCRKRAVSSCGWSHAGTNKPSTARRERERESCCHQRWIQRLNAGVQGDYDEEGACMHALICKSRFSCLGFFFPIQGTESGELLMKLQAHWGAAWTVFASRSRHCCSCFPGWNNSFLRFHPRNTCEPTLTALHGAWRVSRNRGVSALFVISARIFSTPLSNPVILYAFVT